MVTLKNKINGTVSLNLPTRSLTLTPKQIFDVTFEEYQSEEIKQRIARDKILVLRMDSKEG